MSSSIRVFMLLCIVLILTSCAPPRANPEKPFSYEPMRYFDCAAHVVCWQTYARQGISCLSFSQTALSYDKECGQ
jgi:hypothetical protein